MELESNSPDNKPSDISDEMRLDASTRLRTLAPIHEGVAANDLPEETVVSQNLSQGPIANVANDSEATTAYNKDAQATPTKSASPAVAIVVTVIALVIVTIVMLVFIK